MLPLLLSPLMTSCNLSGLAGSNQRPENPTQASARTPRVATAPDATAPDSIKTKALDDIPAKPPKPSQAIPQLMSQAASTAKTEPLTAAAPQVNEGPFRVGNQTEHPLRIAFLAQSLDPMEAPAAAATESAKVDSPEITNPEITNPEASSPEASPLPEPFHWDFAPAEGGQNGLLLALPEGDLSLQTGDVVVAFAQDGSQRYWGPYIVGKTSLPHWNSDREEWQLLVQP